VRLFADGIDDSRLIDYNARRYRRNGGRDRSGAAHAGGVGASRIKPKRGNKKAGP